MKETERIQIRLLFESDIPAAMKLKEVAGWNQTEDDWRRLITLEPQGCFGAVKDGRLVGTTTTTTYGSDLAWIGMVLVEPESRRMGIATKLMETALSYLDSKVDCVKLDATAEGQPVYERFGFRVESKIERWFGPARQKVSGPRNQEFSGELHPSLYELDLLAFGANRSGLIRSFIEDSHFPPVINSKSDGSVLGFALVRPGTRAAYVGPIVTTDSDQIEELLDQALDRVNEGRVIVDWNIECPVSTVLLSDRGFVKERDLIRMTTSSASKRTSPLVVAIAAPEAG